MAGLSCRHCITVSSLSGCQSQRVTIRLLFLPSLFLHLFLKWDLTHSLDLEEGGEGIKNFLIASGQCCFNKWWTAMTATDTVSSRINSHTINRLHLLFDVQFFGLTKENSPAQQFIEKIWVLADTDNGAVFPHWLWMLW